MKYLTENYCIINDLKCGKANGLDDIRNEYVRYKKQNLKLILNQPFNMIYDTVFT